MPEAIPHFEIALKIKPAFKDAEAALELARRLSPSTP
jgi:hypothetical protein